MAQHAIQLEERFFRPPAPRYESTDTLLKDEETSYQESSPINTGHEPSMLHPTMWLWEILSLGLAALILVAVLAILATYNRKPSPVVGGITLNTVVAFASTLFRICLMVPVTGCIGQLTWTWLHKGYKPLQDIVKFDLASRGPIGSLQLLWEVKLSPLISIAGWVVITGIAIGPFFQQSVVFYGARVPSPNAGTGTPPLEAFASTAFTYTGSVGYVGGRVASYGIDVPFNLKSAIRAGLYSSGMISLSYPPYSCPSGNCTWDPFPTLGVSVQCADDTSNYFLNCSEPNSQIWPGHTWQPCTVRSRNFQPIHEPDFTTVYDSSSLWMPDSPTDSDTYFATSNFDYGFEGKSRDTWTSINAGFTAFRWYLARDLFVFPVGQARSSTITSNSTIEAGYCIFYMDMQIVRAEVESGVYKEHILDSTTSIQPYQNVRPVDGNRSNEDLYGTHGIGVDEEGTLTYTYTPDCQASPPPTECGPRHTPKPILITISRQRYTNIVAAIRNSLPLANLTTGGQSGLHSSGVANPEAAECLYRAPSIPDTMRTIAHYMTVALRANDTILARQNHPTNSTGLPAQYVAPSHRVSGTVYIQAVHLRVRWGWLAFPAGLLVITAVVLFETIRTSRPEGIGIWKNNALAVLLNTQWKPEAGMMGAATSEGLDEIAKGLEARVVQGADVPGARRSVTIRKRHVS